MLAIPFRIAGMRFPTLFLAASLMLLTTLAYAADAVTSLGTQAAVAGERPDTWSATAQDVLISALSLTGIKYKYGGSSPETGFDCSGFVRYVFQQAASLTLPHEARALSRLGEAVPIDQLQPGDLVFFKTLKSAFSHVGIYLGNKRFIHAPSSGGGIHVVNMDDAYWAKRFSGARRIEGEQETAVAISDK